MQKCPSAPEIAQHKLDHGVTLAVPTITTTKAEQSEGQRYIHTLKPMLVLVLMLRLHFFILSLDHCSLRPPPLTMTGKYRVLTPTMYRSRMAATRQAISMDCGEGSGTGGIVGSSVGGPGGRGGSSGGATLMLRTSSPFQRLSLARPQQQQDSLDLELGASATRVGEARQRQQAPPGKSQHRTIEEELFL